MRNNPLILAVQFPENGFTWTFFAKKDFNYNMIDIVYILFHLGDRAKPITSWDWFSLAWAMK